MNLFQMCNTNFLAFIFNCVNEMFPFCLCFRQSPISKWVDFLWHCSKHMMENNFYFVLLNFSPYAFCFPLWYLFISTNDWVVHWRMCFLLTVTFLLQVSSHFDNMTCFPCYHLSICTLVLTLLFPYSAVTFFPFGGEWQDPRPLYNQPVLFRLF